MTFFSPLRLTHSLIVTLLILPTSLVAGERPPAPVITTTPILQIMQEEIVVTGTLLANESVAISPEIAGTVSALPFKEGGAIKQDDLILELNDNLFNAELKQAKASYHLAKIRHDRLKKLLAKKSVSQSVYDESVAELNERMAVREVAEVKLAKAHIRAPFSGYIGFRHTSVGAYVTPGEQLFTLVDDAPLKLQFRVPERLANTVKNGGKITFEVNTSGQPKRYQAEIFATEAAITPNSRTLHAKAIFSNEKRQVMAGSFAKIYLSLGNNQAYLTVPAEALIGTRNGYQLFVVVDGKAEVRSVTTGVRRNGIVSITAGLESALPVIVAGHQLIGNGSPVNVTKQQDAAQ